MSGLHILLAAVALVTATISGVIGMGGGILLLATIFCFLDHADAIPLHGTVQLASNSTRVLAFLGSVDWQTVGRFCIGALPGSVIGGVLLWAIGTPGRSEPYLKTVIGLYILMTVFLPKRTRSVSAGKAWDWPVLGLAAGTAAITVGAVGPLIAPLFARRAFVKERLIATKAVCQAILHVVKLPIFFIVRELAVGRLATLALVMIAMVIPGTLLGKRVLQHVSEPLFVRLYQAALVVAGLKVLLVDGAYRIWMGSR